MVGLPVKPSIIFCVSLRTGAVNGRRGGARRFGGSAFDVCDVTTRRSPAFGLFIRMRERAGSIESGVSRSRDLNGTNEIEEKEDEDRDQDFRILMGATFYPCTRPAKLAKSADDALGETKS